jgi:hypothetical protein
MSISFSFLSLMSPPGNVFYRKDNGFVRIRGWRTLGEIYWRIVGENPWRTVGENHWRILGEIVWRIIR